MLLRHARFLHGIALGLFVLGLGCSHSNETASKDTMTADVGRYPLPPSGVNRPRVGVPPFKVTTSGWSGGGTLDELAADQMTTLLDQTDRFTVIERAQLQKLIDEQNLEGIVKSGELARQGQVRGVDYLLIGKVTNLRVKRETKGNNFGLGQLGSLGGGAGNIAGGAAVSTSSVDIKTDCGVDIRLVNPTTGELLVSNFSEFSRTDSASSMGVTILGANTASNADIQLSEDDKGKILRLALDDAVRKSLPKIDHFLVNQPAATVAAPVPAPAPVVAPAPVAPDIAPVTPAPAPAPATPGAPAASVKYCPNCGAANAIDAKFCAKCGHKLD
jgi:curli biogenesis system outer membrane secretion channel CsgG